MKLLVVERIHPQCNKFATGVENKGTGNSKLNDSPASLHVACSSRTGKYWLSVVIARTLLCLYFPVQPRLHLVSKRLIF